MMYPSSRFHAIAIDCLHILGSRLPVMLPVPDSWGKENQPQEPREVHDICDDRKHLRLTVFPTGGVSVYICGKSNLLSALISTKRSDWDMALSEYSDRCIVPAMESLVAYYLRRETPDTAIFAKSVC